MNNNAKTVFKPVGFVLSKEEMDIEGELFSDNVTFLNTKVRDWYLKLWYIGDFQKSTHSKCPYYFSFPQSSNLLDRNLIISETNNGITIENDWLGSIPVFYNKKDCIISTVSNVCLKDKSFDEEGLRSFFEFGYSVFERTPFKDVGFMRYYSTLVIERDVITVEYKVDPALNLELFKAQSAPNEVIQIIQDYIIDAEQTVAGDIIIPTSGGYDSRLLNWGVNDKSRIRSFTYGLSENQHQSHEVVFAKKISEILDTDWSQIELSNYNNYINDWHNIFGFSTHLHGMYHLEFYKKITSHKDFNSNSTLLSGIIGDAWAGSVETSNISSERDISKLGYSHGLFLDKRFLKSKTKNLLSKKYFEQNKESLNNPQFQVISIMRMKMILLSYLTAVPEYFGVPVWTPFLDFNVATAMLRLPAHQRKNRRWQGDFFRSIKLDIENMSLRYSTVNSLNQQVAKNFSFEPIRGEDFENFLEISRVDQLNKSINNQHEFWEPVLTKLKLRSILRRIGMKKIGYLRILANYQILKAVEKSRTNEY